MSSTKIQTTKNYRLFVSNADNRQVDLTKHKKLFESMKLYGFLREYPVIVFRDDKGRLVVKDGQHRLAIAESLHLPVYWIEATTDFDIALVNSTPKIWVLRDYAQKFAANGSKAYEEGLAFAENNHLPIGIAFAMLAGTTSFGNCQSQFIDGTFKIKDRPWADAVAGIYVPVVGMSQLVRNARFLEACMAVCRVQEFDVQRFVSQADKCRDKLSSFSTRDAYLEMIEAVYNFGRHKLVPVKILATMAMRDRSAFKAAKDKKGAKKDGGEKPAA